MRTVVLLLFAAIAAFGQTGGNAPDCTFTATLTSATTSTPINNKPTATGGNPCLYWVVVYFTNGASGVSVTLEGAADAAGAPTGSYTALTATSGTVNPMVGTAEGSAILCCDYYPWLRFNAGTFSGSGLSMILRVYGWKNNPNPTAGGGGISANVDLVAVGGAAITLGQKLMAASLPVTLASDQSAVTVGGAAAIGAGPTGNPVPTGWRNSAGVIVPEYCTSKATIGTLSTGANQLVAVSGGTTIYVCEVFFSGETIATFQLITGTGSSCTSPTSETGIISGAGAGVFGIDIAPPNGVLVTTAAKTLCLSVSAGSVGGGYILYSQR